MKSRVFVLRLVSERIAKTDVKESVLKNVIFKVAIA